MDRFHFLQTNNLSKCDRDNHLSGNFRKEFAGHGASLCSSDSEHSAHSVSGGNKQFVNNNMSR